MNQAPGQRTLHGHLSNGSSADISSMAAACSKGLPQLHVSPVRLGGEKPIPVWFAASFKSLGSSSVRHHLTAGSKRDRFVQESIIILVARVFPQLQGRERTLASFSLLKVMVKVWRVGEKMLILKRRRIHISSCSGGGECCISGTSVTEAVTPHFVELTVEIERQNCFLVGFFP